MNAMCIHVPSTRPIKNPIKPMGQIIHCGSGSIKTSKKERTPKKDERQFLGALTFPNPKHPIPSGERFPPISFFLRPKHACFNPKSKFHFASAQVPKPAPPSPGECGPQSTYHGPNMPIWPGDLPQFSQNTQGV